MTDYYLAAAGSDSYSGRSARFPWRTITKLNTVCAAGTIQPGDRVWFHRGDTFYGKIRPPVGLTWAGTPLTFGGYGSTAAARPEISSYKVLNTAAGWSAYDANTWQIDVANAGAGTVYTGYDGVQGGGTNIGFLRVDGVIYGNLKASQAALASPWDFAVSGTVLYVRATGNPTSLAADIQAACDTPAISLQSAVQIIGLKVVGSGGHGMKTASGTTYDGIRIYDCEFAELGGSILTGTTRYGNGLELWANTNDVIAERNTFHDIYDTAFTMQGPSSPAAAKWTDVAFRRNLMYRNSQSLEFWFGGTTTPTDGHFNCVVEYNTCLFAGYGWGAEARPDQNVRVHLLTYTWPLTSTDLKVRHNVFHDARTAYRYSSAGTPPTGMTRSTNLVLQRPGGLLKYGDAQTIESGDGWAVADGSEANTQFVVLPASADTAIDDSDVTAALTYLDAFKAAAGRVAHISGTPRNVPVYAPWRP